jgi:hypothetical protein
MLSEYKARFLLLIDDVMTKFELITHCSVRMDN